METAASTAGLSAARQGLLHSMERLRESVALPTPADGCLDTGETETHEHYILTPIVGSLSSVSVGEGRGGLV